MEDGRCKLGLAGRLELVRRIEAGATMRQAAACLGVAPATAHRWWWRWRTADEEQRASLACLRTRPPRPRSCPWALDAAVEQRILSARRRINYGPARLAGLVGRHRSTVWKVLRRHGCSRRRRSEPRQSMRRYEWAQPGALLHIDAMQLAKFDRPGHWAIGRGYQRCAARARSMSSRSSTTTPGSPTQSCTAQRPALPSPPRSGGPSAGCASRAAGRPRRS